MARYLIKATTLLTYRHSQTITSTTTSLDQMVQASRQDERTTLDLTRATRKDSNALKVVAIITVIYLPGTFVAVRRAPEKIFQSTVANPIQTLFSTGFMNLSSVGDQLANQITTQASSYAGVTVSLMLITLCTAYFWNRRLQLQESPDSGTC